MSELNREQVKQALECCTHIPRPDCNNCPMGEKRGCVIALIEFALKHYTELIEENKSLNQSCSNFVPALNTVRANTVRKMQAEIINRCIHGGIYPAFVASTIDKIAKEMLEDE
jgi:hypothetical protein